MHGRDTFACAQTGSGKTASYVLPIVQSILSDESLNTRNVNEPCVLILAPTRELAIQIHEVCLMFTYGTNLKAGLAYGGQFNRREQIKTFESGVDIVVACPGRLKDFVSGGLLKLSHVSFLVLDECDRMLDMGFEPAVREIVSSYNMPPKEKRHTYLCSATIPQSVVKLADDFMHEPLLVTVGYLGKTPVEINQKIYYKAEEEKLPFLKEVIDLYKGQQILIFVETKKKCDWLQSFLTGKEIACACIHGDKVQSDRIKYLKQFKRKEIDILIATDVASRGLDIPDVAVVVNLDMPKNIEDYTHRIGRTGRIGNKGIAISVVNENDKPVICDLHD